MTILEVCIDSYEKGVQACLNGAKRLELCSDLALEGFTPSEELIEEFMRDVLRRSDDNGVIPIHVMIRPIKRDSNILDTFCYDSNDLQIMKEQIRMCRKLIDLHAVEKSRFKIEGFVIGCIKKENGGIIIDTEILKELCETIQENNGHFNITFHKAFDLLTHPAESLDILLQFGINRILTSLCFAYTDLKGKITAALESNNSQVDQFLKHLKEINQHQTVMTLLIGGGVRECNQLSIINFMNQNAIIPFELHSSTPFLTIN